MDSAAPQFRALPRRRTWILFGVFLGLWIALTALNRPEPHYSDQPLSYWLERLAQESTAAQASSVLTEMGPEAIPALTAALHTRPSPVRDSFHAAAVRVNLAAPRSYDAPNIRATSAYLLGQLREAGRPAVPDLIQCLGDEDPMVRFRSIRALSKIGMVAAPDLAEALRNREPVVRYGAAKALGGMGNEARYSAGALKDALNDPQANVREAAFQALAQIGERAQRQFTAASIPQLIEALTNSNWSTSRKFAVQTLRRLGPDAKPATGALLAARKSAPELENEIHDALLAIGK